LLWLNNAQSTGGMPTGIQFVAYDGNGNVAGLFAASDGSNTARYEYGPFGEPLRSTGPLAAANPVRWSTKVTDDESGLVYYGFRYYSSATGRWLNRDPINELGFNLLIQSQNPFNLDEEKNLYGLARNNPVVFYDADGRIVPVIILGGVAIGAAEAAAAAFGLSLAACLASPPCAQAVRDAIAEAIREIGRFCSRRLSTCTVRCPVVQIGNENNVIGWTQATATGSNRRAACAAAEAAARGSTAPGTRTKHCFPR